MLYTSGIVQFVLWISYIVIDEQGYKNYKNHFLLLAAMQLQRISFQKYWKQVGMLFS